MIHTCIHIREQDWDGNNLDNIPKDYHYPDQDVDFLDNCNKINETTTQDVKLTFRQKLIVFHGNQYIGFMIYIVGYLFTKLIQLALEIYEYIIWRDIRIDPTTKNLKLRTYTKGLLSVAEITLFIVILAIMFRPKYN